VGDRRIALAGEPPKPKGSRPRIDARAAVTGILFVLRTVISWEMLPQEMDCCSGMTCWRGLRERLHGAVLDHLGQTDRIDWSRASLDPAAAPAPLSENTFPNPKRHGV
jgi:transposase